MLGNAPFPIRSQFVAPARVTPTESPRNCASTVCAGAVSRSDAKIFIVVLPMSPADASRDVSSTRARVFRSVS